MRNNGPIKNSNEPLWRFPSRQCDNKKCMDGIDR